MPRIFFQNEYREVECEPGANLHEVATRHGIDINKNVSWLPVLSRDGSCSGLGVCGTCQVWVKSKTPDALSPPTRRERYLHGMKGWRRLACLTRVQGDIEVWTGAGGPDRLVRQRPIATPPSPLKEREEREAREKAAQPAPAEGSAAPAEAAEKPAKPEKPTKVEKPARPTEKPAEKPAEAAAKPAEAAPAEAAPAATEPKKD